MCSIPNEKRRNDPDILFFIENIRVYLIFAAICISNLEFYDFIGLNI
jgi:hypothetical protein